MPWGKCRSGVQLLKPQDDGIDLIGSRPCLRRFATNRDPAPPPGPSFFECQNEAMDVPAPGGAITISRRTVIQDLLRRYTVFIDGVAVGYLWPFQTRRYEVATGLHHVRLAMPTTGTASSDEVAVDVTSGATRVLRTHGRGLRKYITLPIATVISIRSRVTGKPFESRWYKRPWIILQVED